MCTTGHRLIVSPVLQYRHGVIVIHIHLIYYCSHVASQTIYTHIPKKKKTFTYITTFYIVHFIVYTLISYTVPNEWMNGLE